MFRGLFLGSLVIVALGNMALAQSLVPSHSSIFPTPNDLTRHHTAATGKPCLAVQGYPKAQAINSNIFEHWVSVTNSCGEQIKLQVCYHKTQDCIAMSVPPWGRKDSVLGIFPALADFQFDAKEQF
jgi:hypothetical protein